MKLQRAATTAMLVALLTVSGLTTLIQPETSTDDYEHIPESMRLFEPNYGQHSDPTITAISHQPYYQVLLNNKGFYLNTPQQQQYLEFTNSNPLIPEFKQPQNSYSNYLSENPLTKIPHYQQITFKNVYDNIDIVFYGKDNGAIEFDYVIHPGGDPTQIHFTTQQPSQLNRDGTIQLTSELTLNAPYSYQNDNTIDSHYQQTSTGYTIVVDNYDTTQPLIIDPYVTYSTFFGGSSDDLIITSERSGPNSILIGANTISTNYPTTPGAHQTSISSSFYDIAISQFQLDGTLDYSTYLGGSGTDTLTDLQIMPNGNIAATGSTRSGDFPTTNTAQQTQLNGGSDAFLTIFNPQLNNLEYSTYLGGDQDDALNSISLQPNGQLLLGGQTSSTDLNTLNPTQPTLASQAQPDGMYTIFNQASRSFELISYFGGSDYDNIKKVLSYPDNTILLITDTDSTNLPTINALQNSKNSGSDIHITRIAPVSYTYEYGTYLGGNSDDIVVDAILDQNGKLILTGFTDSTNYPLQNAQQPQLNGNQDGFISRLNVNLDTLEYSTYLGGTAQDNLGRIYRDINNHIYITGVTLSTNFPVTSNATQSFNAGNIDSLLIKLQDDTITFSTYLGGTLNDIILSATVDDQQHVTVVGRTGSNDYPITSDAYKTNLAGTTDGFITTIKTTPTARANFDITPTDPRKDEPVQFTDRSTYTKGTPTTWQWDFDDGTTSTQQYPIHTFTNHGTYDVTLTTTFSNGETATIVRQIAVVNDPPIANAGPDQTVIEETLVTLDGTQSYDPENEAITFNWQQLSGPTITLSDDTSSTPTFQAPTLPDHNNQEIELGLTINDGNLNSAMDIVKITVRKLNDAPIADAGTNQAVPEESRTLLDGTGSSDPDGDPLTYQWSQVSGPSVTINNATSAIAEFITPTINTNQAIDYTFQLVVHDSIAPSTPSEVTITVENINKAPHANAGPDFAQLENTLVTLNGTRSLDADADGLTYQWRQLVGPTVTLYNDDTAEPYFEAPTVTTNHHIYLTFGLQVNDGQYTSTEDTVNVLIKKANQPPTAYAGHNITGLEKTIIELDGTGSSDPDGDPLTYQWSQVSGPAVTFNDASKAMPRFMAPEIDSNTPIKLVFKLQVTDGIALSNIDYTTVTITNQNQAPTADAGPVQIALEQTLVTLNGKNSTDPENDTLTYQWTQTAGPTVTLVNATTAQPSFTTPNIGESLTKELKFQLIVNDGNQDSTIAITKVIVKREAAQQQLIVDFSTNKANPTTADLITFTAVSDAPREKVVYAWDLGGEATRDDLQQINYQFTKAGVYQIKLTATHGETNQVKTMTKTIIVTEANTNTGNDNNNDQNNDNNDDQTDDDNTTPPANNDNKGIPSISIVVLLCGLLGAAVLKRRK